MSQLVNYSIIEAGLRALADKAHESAVAQAEGNLICFFLKGCLFFLCLISLLPSNC